MKTKNVKTNKKNKIILFTTIFVILIPALFYYVLYKTYAYIEERENEIYNQAYSTAFEIGHYQGLNEANSDKEFYQNLSVNPKVAYLFEKYFPNREQARIMRAISLAESKGKQTAINKANRNGSIDSGFFQINTIHKKKGETIEQFINRTHDLEANFKEARRILDLQGYAGWSTYNSGDYLNYIK